MKVTPLYILLIVLIVVSISGCAQPPIAEMDNAREAVFRAENDADAAQYAGSTLSRARSALGNMQMEADSKRYDAARTHAAEAVAAAEKAIADGRAAAQRAVQDSASVVSNLKTEIEETSINVNGARYSLLDLDYDALDNGIINAYNTADRAEADLAAGNYRDAIDKARVVRTDLAQINQQVAGAAPIRKK